MDGERLNHPENGESEDILRQNLAKLTIFGEWGISIVDGLGRSVYAQNPEQPFSALSVNKLLPALYVNANIDSEDRMSLASPLGGAGRYDIGGGSQAEEGTRITVGEAVEDSIVYSGNTAAKSLIAGRADAINKFVADEVGIYKSAVEQTKDGRVSFGHTTPNDMIRLLQYASRQAPEVMDLMEKSVYQSGLRRYLSSHYNLTVGTKYGSDDEEGLRHEVGLMQHEDRSDPKETLFCAVFSKSKVPKIATGIISLIGAEIYEHYYGQKAVPALGKAAISSIPYRLARV